MVRARPAASGVTQHNAVGTDCRGLLLELGNRISLENAEQGRSVTGEKTKSRELRRCHLGLHHALDRAALERRVGNANIRLCRP